MMQLEQAREVIDIVLRQARMTRDDHSIAGQALQMLYDEAMENREARQAYNAAPQIIPIHPAGELKVKD